MKIRLTVPCVPVAQPRAKATSFGGHTRMYTPTTLGKGGDKKPHPIVAFKATLRQVASKAFTLAPLTGPLTVNVTAVFPRGKVPKKLGAGRLPHIVKPDRDNLDKAVLDGLKGIIFADDKQVCDGRIQKFRASASEQPHVEIEVESLEVRHD